MRQIIADPDSSFKNNDQYEVQDRYLKHQKLGRAEQMLRISQPIASWTGIDADLIVDDEGSMQNDSEIREDSD